MVTLIEDDGCVYFRCEVGKQLFGFSLLEVQEDKRYWIATKIEQSLIEAYNIGLKKGDLDRLKMIKTALDV